MNNESLKVVDENEWINILETRLMAFSAGFIHEKQRAI